MENWNKYVEDRTRSVADVSKLIESGDVIWLGNTMCIPYEVLDTIADRYEELENVTYLSNMFLKPTKHLMDPKYRKAFRTLSYFPNMLERAAHKANLVEYVPIPYSYVPYSATDIYKTNVFMTEVCEPDENGYVNVGVLGTTFTPQIMRAGKFDKKIAVINKEQPKAKGEVENVCIHISEFDYFCHSDHELPSIPPSAPEEVDKQIADYIMEYINDGSTVQIGLGGLANAVAGEMTSKKNLKVYTEIVTDACVDLAEKGCLREIVAAGAFGMPRLYKFLGESDLITFGTSENVISFDAVSQEDDFVGINGCLMADVTGQACSEAIGPLQYASVGGQADFVKGANKGRNAGKNSVCFLAMRSAYTDKDGNLVSNILTELPPASVVTTPRGEAMFYVTEYGVAEVYGKSINDRVRAMISIAHPDFREELKEKSIALGIAFPSDFE
ncbi:acetyl-CoA hydrolase/transferase C-terminal domain-containing protein [Eubacteriaceae bacterium ES3]|nr:acetyl-CoA hydrolase/transferase C-terminal domain-containing protein [Eubacteriaceae bacterium ES3]